MLQAHFCRSTSQVDPSTFPRAISGIATNIFAVAVPRFAYSSPRHTKLRYQHNDTTLTNFIFSKPYHFRSPQQQTTVTLHHPKSFQHRQFLCTDSSDNSEPYRPSTTKEWRSLLGTYQNQSPEIRLSNSFALIYSRSLSTHIIVGSSKTELMPSLWEMGRRLRIFSRDTTQKMDCNYVLRARESNAFVAMKSSTNFCSKASWKRILKNLQQSLKRLSLFSKSTGPFGANSISKALWTMGLWRLWWSYLHNAVQRISQRDDAFWLAGSNHRPRAVLYRNSTKFQKASRAIPSRSSSWIIWLM